MNQNICYGIMGPGETIFMNGARVFRLLLHLSGLFFAAIHVEFDFPLLSYYLSCHYRIYMLVSLPGNGMNVNHRT